MERSRNEKNLGILDKSKFLVPEELTMGQLTSIIRSVQKSLQAILNNSTTATSQSPVWGAGMGGKGGGGGLPMNGFLFLLLFVFHLESNLNIVMVSFWGGGRGWDGVSVEMSGLRKEGIEEGRRN